MRNRPHSIRARLNCEMPRLIWWLLVGLLLIDFALTDGFDKGVGT